MLSTLRLFKAVPVEATKPQPWNGMATYTVPRGYILSPEVTAYYRGTSRDYLLRDIESLYGRDAAKLNNAFHKSWEKVKHSSMEQLVLEQIVHYISTYGFEAAGVFSNETVFVPAEVLNAPEFKDGLRLVVIRGLTKDQLREELLKLLSTGIALAEETIKDVLEVASFVGFNGQDVEKVKNREVKAALYAYFGIVPANAQEFLRYVVYRTTGSTMLIKNPATVAKIKPNVTMDVVRAWDIYVQQHGVEKLGEIFLRYKPIFLAFRTDAHMKQIINSVRRAARSAHKPMPEDRLNTVTERLSKGQSVLGPEFSRALEEANTFRKVRLAYALKFRLSNPDSVVFRIRNGKTWVTDYAVDPSAKPEVVSVYEIVVDSIISDLSRAVAGKALYIPEGVHYALPATEKQFTGNLPTGTYVECEKNMVVGVHWTDVDHNRIDLDLSLLSAGFKMGWDAGYRTGDREIMFSGDQTSAPAPNGASEFYYLGAGARGVYMLVVNYFNYASTIPVPFQIVAAKQKKASDRPTEVRNYIMDPNRILALSNSVMDTHQKTLGIIVAEEGSNRFYFAEFNQQGGRSSRTTVRAEQARKYLLSNYLNAIDLNDLLVKAGGKLVEDPSEADIDLTPESLDKSTIISLLAGGR